ncbi:hypothetical protein CCACVL1_18565 [Corchorus capsularis]|uniref:RecA family profile 1 domain-containing protein n=1 Tax=Corchorus capsularis TaxID=210143 RepID=A0A1R3HKP0_COCAP|nr:hypothetical protein CCACVL1_18565 [Corchorus capsularis]
MKAVRSIYYTHKHFLLLNPTTRRTPVSFSFFPRHFHSSKPRLALSSSESDSTRKTWTVYDPLTGDLSTRSGEQTSSNGDIQSSSGDEVESDFETERTYGKAKNANLRNESDTRKKLSGRVRDSSKEKSDEISPNKAFSVDGSGSQGVVGNKKKGKGKVRWVCEKCGYSDGQWWGYCRSCESSGTMKSFSVVPEKETKNKGLEYSETMLRSWLPNDAGSVEPVSLMEVNRGIKESNNRIPLSGPFGDEVARVLGGGLVPGSLVLIGGDPGVGKSTLLLQTAGLIAERCDSNEPAPVVYVSGEESVQQICSRAERMNIGANKLYLYSGTDIEDILEKIKPLSPQALIVDSIQTVYLKEATGSAGGIHQVRECTSALLRFAKKTNIPVLLAGHVTKSGEIAGPRVLEHIVDTVLYLEGEKFSSHRLLRPVKNRFGSTDELGVFEMSQLGLQAVSNPSEMFLSDQNSDSEFLAGLAVTVIIDGSRAFLIEIQALCVSSSTVSRHVNGIQPTRADMIISVLAKQAGLRIQGNAVFLNVVSGVSLTETAGDLAIAASICSSFLEFPIPNGVAFIGEIGLGGELRMVPMMDKRVITVAKLGYKKCIVPMRAEKSLAALDLVDDIVLFWDLISGPSM